jgi:hypothetical protein
MLKRLVVMVVVVGPWGFSICSLLSFLVSPIDPTNPIEL